MNDILNMTAEERIILDFYRKDQNVDNIIPSFTVNDELASREEDVEVDAIEMLLIKTWRTRIGLKKMMPDKWPQSNLRVRYE